MRRWAAPMLFAAGLLGASMAESQGSWLHFISGIGLTIVLWGTGRALLRWYRVRYNPFSAHFTCRNSAQSVSGRDVSFDTGDPHLLKEAVVPSNSTVYLEVGFKPTIPLYVTGYVFGIRGPANERPKPTAWYESYTAGKRKLIKPKRGTGYSLDIAGRFHIKRERRVAAKEHLVQGFEIKTRKAGLYQVTLDVMTDELSGVDRFWIRVEDRPKTISKCHARSWKQSEDHGSNCLVRPFK